MSATQQAKRRRKQAASGFMNMSPQERPHYKKRSEVVSQQRLAAQIDKERRIQQNKGKSKKS